MILVLINWEKVIFEVYGFHGNSFKLFFCPRKKIYNLKFTKVCLDYFILFSWYCWNHLRFVFKKFKMAIYQSYASLTNATCPHSSNTLRNSILIFILYSKIICIFYFHILHSSYKIATQSWRSASPLLSQKRWMTELYSRRNRVQYNLHIIRISLSHICKQGFELLLIQIQFLIDYFKFYVNSALIVFNIFWFVLI